MKKASWLCAAACMTFGASACIQSASAAVAEPQASDQTNASAANSAAPSSSVDEVVVTGIRASLRSSEAIKRNATQIVDAITAEDAGKFPDNNVSESLQRITGVAIDRSGGEGQFITVRGLGPEFNTVLVNGRIMATDNPGREFSFDVLSPNIIQRTEVYKSSVPQLQEGGIGATVNVVTARPLDGRTGFHTAVSTGGIYDTLDKAASPDFSGVTSYANDDRTFGAVLAGSYTDRHSQMDQYYVHGWLPGAQQTIAGSPTSTGLDTSALGTVDAYAPRDSTYYRYHDRRKRINVAATIQWQPTDQLRLTLDGLYSKFDVTETGHTFGVFYVPPFISPTVNGNGTLTSFNRPGTQFQSANPGLGAAGFASQNDNYGVVNDRFTSSNQEGINLAWTATEQLTLKADASMTEARNRTPAAFVVVGEQAQTAPGWNLNAGNDIPIISNLGTITDPTLERLHYANVSEGRVSDRGQEFHLDGEWSTGADLLKSIMIGTAYNERHKIQHQADNSDTVCAFCGYDVPAPTALLSPYTLSNFLPGASGSGSAPRNFLQFDPNAILAYMSQPSVLAAPRQGNTAAQEQVIANQLAALAGGPYAPRDRPGQLLDVKEKVLAGYVNFVLAGPRWSGNVGARIVDTHTTSNGFDQAVQSIVLQNANDDFYTITLAPASPRQVKNDYVDVLPSVNFKYDLNTSMDLRAAFSETVTRPTLTDLGVNNSYTGRKTAAVSGGGNPNLKPFKSTNYDLAYEYFISPTSYVSVAGFYKKFHDFLEQETLPVTVLNITFQDTRTRNGATGSIAGAEVGGQYTLDNLSGFWSGFGLAGNYTYVSSTAERAQNTNSSCGYNGLSPHSANGSVFYEQYGFQGRISYNWRSSFLVSCFSDYGQPENRRSYGQLDVSTSYAFNDHAQIYAQVVNLTGSYTYDYSVLQERVKLVQDTGRRVLFGARMSF